MPFLALFCVCIDHDPLASVHLSNPSGITHLHTTCDLTTRDVAARLSAFKVKRRENHMDINFMKRTLTITRVICYSLPSTYEFLK